MVQCFAVKGLRRFISIGEVPGMPSVEGRRLNDRRLIDLTISESFPASKRARRVDFLQYSRDLRQG